MNEREILDNAQEILTGAETTVIELADAAGKVFRRVAVDQLGGVRLATRRRGENVITLTGVTMVNDREQR